MEELMNPLKVQKGPSNNETVDAMEFGSRYFNGSGGIDIVGPILCFGNEISKTQIVADTTGRRLMFRCLNAETMKWTNWKELGLKI